MILLTILFIGLLVALISVFIGLGGGVVLVPLMPDVFGLSTHEAVATSLLTIAMVVFLNAYKFHHEKLINWTVVLWMGPISAVTAMIAAQLASRVDSEVILCTFLVILCLVALKTFFDSVLQTNYVAKEDLSAKQKVISGFGGALAGMTSGFVGVGSGVILSPVMIILKTVSPKQLSPTANANMVCATFAATLSNFISGNPVKWNQWGLIRWDISVGVFLSAAFFAHFLRPHQNKLPFRLKSLILSILLVSLIGKILYRLS